MAILFKIVDSLSQNSTWRGLILLATAAGLGLVGLINVLRKGK